MTKAELLEQRAKIDAQIAALEVREPWRAELGAGYYYNDCDGATFWCREAGHRSDDYRHKTGNYFRTKELAEAAEAKRMKRLPQTLAREFLLDVRDECGGLRARVARRCACTVLLLLQHTVFQYTGSGCEIGCRPSFHSRLRKHV